MTDIQPGKRYRITIEGIGNTEGWVEYPPGHFASPAFLQQCTVEFLPDPLPTTPGSVVRWKQWSGELRTLSRETGRLPWRDVNSPHLCFSDEEVQGATVLFDVGD